MLVAIMLWPLILMDEWLKSSNSYSYLPFLIGMFQFVPATIAGLIGISIRVLTLERKVKNSVLYFLPAILMLGGQIPLIFLGQSDKINYLLAPPVGDMLTNWPFYAPFLFGDFVLLIFSVNGAEQLSQYHHQLNDQVVDTQKYKLEALSKSMIALMVIAFFSIALVGLVVFGIFDTRYWQLVLLLPQAAALLIAIVLLLDKRRYSPAPFDVEQFDKHGYSDEQLRHVLKQAEQALIRHKAYKIIGLRIRQLADLAEVEPLALALATRAVLKRNFRAFIYHYRLEYAKKILMRTDAKVSNVAKRLGFDSEKYLSSVFIKYIQMMGKNDKEGTPL